MNQGNGVPTHGLVHPEMQNLVQGLPPNLANGFNHHLPVYNPSSDDSEEEENLVQGLPPNHTNGFNHHIPVYNPSSDDSEEEGTNNHIVVEELPSNDSQEDDIDVHQTDDSDEEGTNNIIVEEPSTDYQEDDIDVHQTDDPQEDGINNIVVEELPSNDSEEDDIDVLQTDDSEEEGINNIVVEEPPSNDQQEGSDVHQHAAYHHQEDASDVHQTDDPQEEGSDDDPQEEGSDVHQHAAYDPQEVAIDVQQTVDDPENENHHRVVHDLRNYLGITLFLATIFFLFRKTETKHLDERNREASIQVGDIYHREASFLWNYAAMEKDFKVFLYPGENATTCYHSTDHKLKSKDASEHYFFMNLRDSRFLTNDPHEALLFFIPISCQKMGARVIENKEKVIQDYVKSLISSCPYWNKTLGAVHFSVSCQDIGNRATEEVPFLLKNAIQLVCSPSYDSKYIPHKDAALPQILELSLPPHHGYDIWNRTKFGFWAGSLNSDVRRNLRNFYKGVQEFHFVGKMRRSTVLVILSDYYDLAFNDILDWNNFFVIIKEDDLPNLQKILDGMPAEKYEKMRQNVLQVRKHLKWNSPPVKYDEFQMVMRLHIIRY